MKRGASSPKPPAGLSKGATSWWTRLFDTYAIDDEAGLLLLELAAKALDRMDRCAALIVKHGEVTVDDGKLRPNPAVAQERDARAQALAAIKQLGLTVEPLHDQVGRPSGR